MNSTLAAEIERIVRAAKQELDDNTVRVHKEMRQISASLTKETGEELAGSAVEAKREANMDVQIIGFIKPYRAAKQRTS